MKDLSIKLRDVVEQNDAESIRRLCQSAGNFREAEIGLAIDVLHDRLTKGPDSGYLFLLAQHGNQDVGYICYGPIIGTEDSWDIYWIVVDSNFRRQGLGGRLICEAERRIAHMGGRRVYIETSSLEGYQSSRAFYDIHGYNCQAVLLDFYGPGDNKLIYVKVLRHSTASRAAA